MIFYLFLITIFNTYIINSYEIASLSIQGSRPYQQDRLYVAQNPNDQLIAAVFDGHGDYGDEVAQVAQKSVPQFFNNIQLTEKNIKATFRSLNNEIYKIVGPKKTKYSGSTGVVLLQDKDNFYIAHCGDSRAVWGKEKHQQTVDHSAANPSEIQRVGNKNVKNISGIPRLGGTLMVTRSFGDMALQTIGLTAEPNVVTLPKKNIAHILLGCDGVFDHTSTKTSENSWYNDKNIGLWNIINNNGLNIQLAALRLAAFIIGKDINYYKGNQGFLENLARDNNIDEAYDRTVSQGMNKQNNLGFQEKLQVVIDYVTSNSCSQQNLIPFINEFKNILHDNTTFIVIKNNSIHKNQSNNTIYDITAFFDQKNVPKDITNRNNTTPVESITHKTVNQEFKEKLTDNSSYQSTSNITPDIKAPENNNSLKTQLWYFMSLPFQWLWNGGKSLFSFFYNWL